MKKYTPKKGIAFVALPKKQLGGSMYKKSKYEASAAAGGKAEAEDVSMEEPSLVDIIQRTHYTKGDTSTIFQMLKDHSSTWFPDEKLQEKLRERLEDIQVVTREEEDAFLRTKVVANNERDCANGEDCEATKIFGPPMPLILVEHWLQSTPRPDRAQFCIMCKRAAVTWSYVNSVAEGDHMGRPFHSHANIIQQEGEYTIEQSVISGSRESHGAMLPCALHCRAWYEYTGAKDGVHWFAQSGYQYPQVFRQLAGGPCHT